MMYESRHTPPLTPRRFARRMANHLGVALVVVGFSLLAGMWGYEHYERLPWRDAFLNTAMLLGGMGPVNAPQTNGGKLFAGFYALYAGGVFLGGGGLLLAPVIHRIAHRLHWEGTARCWSSISCDRWTYWKERLRRCGRCCSLWERNGHGAPKGRTRSARSVPTASSSARSVA